jgi:DNA-binding Lrp family transcriptional regulator
MKYSKKLAVNAKVPTVQLANDLNVITVTIKNRIKRLIDENVIGRFGIIIDLSKTGYRHYNIEINLNDYDKKHEIIKYVRKYQNINEIFQSFGQGVDLNFSYTLKDIKELQDKINDLSSKFPDAIKNFRYFSWEKYLKYNKVPFNE